MFPSMMPGPDAGGASPGSGSRGRLMLSTDALLDIRSMPAPFPDDAGASGLSSAGRGC